MKLTRRNVLGLSVGAAAFTIAGIQARPASAATEATQKSIMDFTGGAEPAAGKVSLTAPEIAENGNTVPVTVSVDSAMEGDDLVASIVVFADGNPNPAVATFHFSEMSGAALATTRIRLAKTQDVIAVAKMKDGSVFMDKKQVKVTIGGCGG
ncbi:thiosulfate oxidation carrier protein SoxY [uncultured Hoeflea sp.]|uniref:thiosulfate oxidation carrier protein SoxY n=1 Tax=uncultured Hoeflea sp. TaxID=538666 RepID=UPI00260765EC|nr:thiosulfate oxidation carrier protein SoxY [uncultured Hoeflea sp.]